MDNRQTERKISSIEILLILGFSCVMLLLSFVFFKERIIFSDTVGSLIDIFKKDSLNVTTNRFVSIFGQFLPFGAWKVGGSLSLIVLLYSVNLILIPICFILLTLFWLRDTRTAWSILLFYLIMGGRTFWFPISEFQGGLCFLLFYAGVFDAFQKQRISKFLFWILSILFIPVVVFSHPLSILVMGAWLVMQFLISARPLYTYAGAFAMIAASYVVREVFWPAEYDAEKKQGLENIGSMLANFWNSTLAQGLYKEILNDYFLLPLLVIGLVIGLVRLKKPVLAVYFFLVLTGFWMLITISFPNETYSWYTEHMYQPLPFFLALTAGRYLPEAFGRKLSIAVFSALLVVSLSKVYVGRERMTDRLEWYEACFKLMDEKGIRKGLVQMNHVDIGWRGESNWITVYESLVLSTMKGPEHAKSVTLVWDTEKARGIIDQGENLIGVGLWYLPIAELPETVFPIGDARYHILTDEFGEERVRSLSYTKDQ